MNASTLAGELLTPDRAGAARAAALLAQGKLVVLPSETVYGIAFDVTDEAARSRVRSLKRLSGPAGFVLHVGHPAEAERFVGDISTIGRRFMQKAWPGPVALSFVLNDAQAVALRNEFGAAAEDLLVDGTLTIRCPEHHLTQVALSDSRRPIAIIGAAPAGHAAVAEISALPEDFLRAVDGMMDDGPTKYRRASTLVRIDPPGATGPGYRVERAGVLDERIVHRMAERLILFVCSGNTCRSPMAAAIASKSLADEFGIRSDELASKQIVVQSAGTHAAKGMRATREAVEAVQAFGGDLSAHQSQPATLDLLRRADVIYTMTESHRDELLTAMPGVAKKTHRLDPDGDIDDPIGAGPAVYRAVATRLSELIKRRLHEMKS